MRPARYCVADDPGDRRFCYIVDAIVATVVPEVAAGVGAEAAAGGALAAGAAEAGTAAITLDPLVISAAAPEIGAGVGGAAGGIGAGVAPELAAGGALAGGGAGLASAVGGGAGTSGALPSDIGGGAGDLAGGLSNVLGAPGGIPGGAVPGAAPPLATTPVTPPASALAPGTSVGGPAAAPPAAPSAGITGAPSDVSTLVSSSTGTPATAASPTTTATGNTGTVLGKATSGLDKALSEATGGNLNLKDVGTIASLGGLGMNFLNRNQPIPGQKQVSQAAGDLRATAAAQANESRLLENFINTGNLPPGVAQGLKTATDAASARIRSEHAARGTSGSSAEAQDIQAAHDRATAAGSEIALQLLNQGISLSGMAVNTEALSEQIYHQIMQDALARDAQLGQAIGNFAGALAGGSRSTTTTTTATA